MARPKIIAPNDHNRQWTICVYMGLSSGHPGRYNGCVGWWKTKEEACNYLRTRAITYQPDTVLKWRYGAFLDTPIELIQWREQHE